MSLSLAILFPILAFAQRDKEATEKIGTSIIAVIIVVAGFAVVNWVKSKNRKEDHNKPL